MDEQNTMLSLKDQAKAKLQAAQEKKKTNTLEAIELLVQAGKLLPYLLSDDSKGSERNSTLGQGTEEILYLSKRGNILYELKEYEEAGTCYKALKDMIPNVVQVYKPYGDCFRKQGSYNEAIKEYELGLQLYKRDVTPIKSQKAGLLNSRGLAYLGLKNFEQARADFDAAIKINGKNPLYHCNMGHVVYALGDKETALSSFRHAIELVESDQLGDLTRQNISYIQKTLKEFTNVLEDLNKIPQPEDSIMEAREKEYVGDGVEAISMRDDSQDEAVNKKSIKDQGIQLKDTKEKLNHIMNQQQLKEYYSGFMFTLSQTYATAIIVNSGQLVIDTGSTQLDILAKAISLLPLMGSQL
ncbi:MAG: tetratricopeptide repeat protein [Bacteroidia bacterium]